jgi:hypothetical protein
MRREPLEVRKRALAAVLRSKAREGIQFNDHCDDLPADVVLRLVGISLPENIQNLLGDEVAKALRKYVAGEWNEEGCGALPCQNCPPHLRCQCNARSKLEAKKQMLHCKKGPFPKFSQDTSVPPLDLRPNAQRRGYPAPGRAHD